MINKKRRTGFTIIELVIVIAVIAILAAVLIPTFSSIIKKANLSADMVAVREMNSILAAEEITDGKPATVVDAQEVLKTNGINDFVPMSSNNEFYWVGGDNRVLLWDAEETKVTYPDEYAKKYKNLTEPSAAWDLLNTIFDDTNYIEIKPEEGKTLGTILCSAINKAKDGAVLKFPENAEISIGGNAYYWESYLKNNGGTGKKITIDLNGGKLLSDKTFVYNGTDYGYYSITIPVGGELTLMNGIVDITVDSGIYASMYLSAGSSLVLKNVKYNTNGSALIPYAEASEIVIENSTITSSTYALSTNRSVSRNIKITINNSTLIATDTSAVLINTPSDTIISNSVIQGSKNALILRAGMLEITNSTLISSSTDAGSFLYKDFMPSTGTGYWLSGATVPAGTLVLGDYHKANDNGTHVYAGNVICNLYNTKLESVNNNNIPEVLLASIDSEKQVVLNYDDSSTIDEIKIYGDDWTPTQNNVRVTIKNVGSIKVNGEEKITE